MTFSVQKTDGLINIIFSVFTTIALMYIFFDEELISNLRIINVKFGNINETKIILASLNLLIIFLTSLSFVIGSSSYYLGFPSALISVKIYQFDYAFNIQLIGYLLLPQIIIQLIGTMYIYKCKIKQLN